MRIGLVGCGAIAWTHLRYLELVPDTEVVALCDVDAARADRLGQEFGIRQRFTELGKLLDETRPDVVHVLTPPGRSSDLAIQALERGVHVLVEKPMARTSAAARKMLDAAAVGGARLGVDHSRLLHPSVTRARGLLDAGELGDLVSVEVVQGFDGPEAHRLLESGSPPWPLSYPFGILEDLLPHPLYLCRAFAGEPARLQTLAVKAGLAPPSPFDELRILWEGERAVGLILLTLGSAPERNTLTLRGTRRTVIVDTNLVTEIVVRDLPLPGMLRKGAISLDVGFQLLGLTLRNTWRHLRGRVRSYPEIGATLASFYDALRHDRPLPAEGSDGLAVVELMESVRTRIEADAAG